MELAESVKKVFRSSSDTSSNKYLMVPIFIFFSLLILAMIRSPIIISQSGIGSAIILSAPLILTTYALTFIVMAGRGGVDLSIGPFMGFINVSSIQLYAHGYLETSIGWFIYAIAMGLIWQLFYALVVVYVRVSPIIVALAGYLAFTGINLVILSRPGGIAPDWLIPWGEGFTIFNEIFLLMILATILFYIITHTAFWGHLKLMGSDERAAFTSGVKINWVRIVAHLIAGIFAALSAICFTALVGSGDPIQGTKYTLLGVTALVLGGASLVGGRGGAFGAILGAGTLYLINYILVTFRFERLQSIVSDLSYGAVLVIALLVSLLLPYVQRVTRGLSVMVFFILMSFAGLFVVIHQVYDQPIVVESEIKQETESIEEQASGGFAFTADGDIGESSTRETAREDLTKKISDLETKLKQTNATKSRQQELEEYEKKYLKESETEVSRKTYKVKATRKIAQIKLKPEPKKKSRQQELEEYEKKYLNESETNVSWKAYDVKAKRKVEIQNPKAVKMKNGKWAVKGTSPITGIKVFRIVGNEKPAVSAEKTADSPKAKKEPAAPAEKPKGSKKTEPEVFSRYYRSPEAESPKAEKPKSKKPNPFCEECGSKIAAKDMFCINCGAKR